MSEFAPISVPLVSGARQDLADLSTEDPSALQVSENALYTRKGSVRARPGKAAHNETAETFAIDQTAARAALSVARGSLVPAGMAVLRGGAGSESPAALYQGRAWRFTDDGIWGDMGTFWSTRITVS
jgi:hypothetical protein